jgi:hypothetical protein
MDILRSGNKGHKELHKGHGERGPSRPLWLSGRHFIETDVIKPN